MAFHRRSAVPITGGVQAGLDSYLDNYKDTGEGGQSSKAEMRWKNFDGPIKVLILNLNHE